MKPRILMLAQFPPPVHGSALVSQAIRDSDAIGEAFDIDAIDISTARNIDQIGRISFGKVVKFLTLLLKVVAGVWRKNYDLVYVTLSPHGPGFYKDSMLALVARLFGIPQVFHLHGKGISRIVRSSRIRRLSYGAVFGKAQVILLSARLYDDIADLVPRNRVHFLGNSVECQEMTGGARRDPSQVRVLYLSNMVPSKGPMVLLEAVRTLRDRGYRFQAVFAGDWAEEASFRRQFLGYVQQHTLQDYVVYVGPQYGAEKRKLLNSAHIFVLPTWDECFPLSILEAMSCGLPVVSTYEGAIPDIIDEGRTGFLVQQRSVEELTDRLEMLLDDQGLRAEMGSKAKEKYRSCYTMGVFEKLFITTIERALAVSRMAPARAPS